MTPPLSREQVEPTHDPQQDYIASLEARVEALQTENNLMAAHQGVDNYQRCLTTIADLQQQLAALTTAWEWNPQIYTCPAGHRFRTTPNSHAVSEREWACSYCLEHSLTAARQALADEQELRMKAEGEYRKVVEDYKQRLIMYVEHIADREAHITFMQTVSTEQLETIRRLTSRSAHDQDS